ncbi:DUF4336 domain-containing protein [Myxococcota bacterium]|nr:DUF4336 domain-containing protein [Myxococcota bacterium]
MNDTTDSGMLRLYEPLDTLKPVAEDLWCVDGPAVRMAFAPGIAMPFPTRMTVVRLSGGDLWIHSPTRLTPGLKAEVEALGRVAHLVSPNFIHYASIPEWSAAFPEARTWASPGVRERAASQGIAVRFDADLGDGPEAAWDRDLDQLLFAGSRVMREVVFLHRRTRTLILADLIENFEADAVAPRWRWLLRLAGNVDPDGKAPLDVRLTFRRGRAEARASLARILDWKPERVILAHGRWYESDGVAELERAFRWLA